MKNKTIRITILFTGYLIVSQAVCAMEDNGNIRANTGSKSAGGGQICFGLAGAESKYRLGVVLLRWPTSLWLLR